MKTLKFSQLPPSNKVAIKFLRQLFNIVTFTDIDATTHDGAKKTLARWYCAEAAFQRLEISLNLRKLKRKEK